jgi:hypothetical protein
MDDDRRSAHPSKYALAALYGLLIGYLISVSSFAILLLAALAAQVFAKKVDTTAHRIGFLTAALSLLVFGIPVMEMPVFIIFLVAAFLDEIDYVGSLRWVTDWRPFLKCAALAFVLVGRWDYFAGIIAFDVGYEALRFVITKAAAAHGKAGKKKTGKMARA